MIKISQRKKPKSFLITYITKQPAGFGFGETRLTSKNGKFDIDEVEKIVEKSEMGTRQITLISIYEITKQGRLKIN